MERFDQPQPAAAQRAGNSPSVADQNAAKSVSAQARSTSAPSRLLTPAVQRVIDWHQGRIAAQQGGGGAEAPSAALLDPAPPDAVLRS